MSACFLPVHDKVKLPADRLFLPGLMQNANNGEEADEPVPTTAPKLSWRERAMLKKQQQAGS